jgi:hypothetical protein
VLPTYAVMENAAPKRQWWVTLYLLVLSGVVYPLIGFAFATRVPHNGGGANVPAIVVAFALPVALSVGTAAVVGRPWRTRLGLGALSAIAVIALFIALLIAIARSGFD